MKKIKAIAAMAENRVIGNKGVIPWHLPEDFRWFKQATMGGVLVMGRKTFESIGKPLPGRETYVLSRTTRSIEGVHNFSNLDILQKIDTDKTIWIAGGAKFTNKCCLYVRKFTLAGCIIATKVIQDFRFSKTVFVSLRKLSLPKILT